ncbi:hypothetical protein ACFQDJ_26185 [Pseudomonas brassicacearum]
MTATHGLTQADLDWLQHIALPDHTQRAAQTPPMFAETILLQADEKSPIALAGCFVLSTSSNSAETSTHPVFLYTPRGGIKSSTTWSPSKNRLTTCAGTPRNATTCSASCRFPSAAN